MGKASVFSAFDLIIINSDKYFIIFNETFYWTYNDYNKKLSIINYLK